MAVSGSFAGTTSNNNISSKITWSAKQSTTGNYSDVTATLTYSRTNTGYTTEGDWVGSITINGTTTNGAKHIAITYNSNTVAMSATTRVYHDPDGTKSITISCTGSAPPSSLESTTCEARITLTTIPRASTITCTEANIESNPTITITRASTSFTHTITYRFGSLSGTIVEKSSATSITSWTIPDSFYAQIPNAKKGEGTLTCTTYSGSTPIGDPQTCKLVATTDEAKCKPTVAGKVVDVRQKTIDLTGNPNVLVRYASIAECTIDVTLNKNAGSIRTATIQDIAVDVDGDPLTIANPGTGTFNFYARDSREYYGEDKVVKDFVLYIPLTCNATIQRDDPTSGKATLEIEGNYFKGNFGAADNSLKVSYKVGDEADVPVTPTIRDGEYSARVSLQGLDYTKSFNIVVTVEDEINTLSKPLTLAKGIPVFDWGEDDFNFNVPVTILGLSVLEKLNMLKQDPGESSLYRMADGEKEYFNPPMASGVEYRTIERWNGKPVYTKLVDFGAMPNATMKPVLHNLRATQIVRFAAQASDGAALPYVDASTRVEIACTATYMIVTTNSDATANTATFQVWYTKD